MTKYQIPIKLTILGPFLTATTSSEVYGLQKAFSRNAQNQPVIFSSHIKGKLRMALDELTQAGGLAADVNAWFGTGSEEKSYEPLQGLLMFSDFKLSGQVKESKRTRTAINAKSGTAAENQLRQVEELFLSGSKTIWDGMITFFSPNDDEAITIKNVLHVGFKWLTNLGSEKGVGFGRLFQVELGAFAPANQSNFESLLLGEGNQLHLRIQPVERIMIGGVKKPRNNYVRSERIIPGAVIKGALATCLNQAHGIYPYYLPLSNETADRMPDYKLLALNFDHIRVTHAFPAKAGQPRPVKVPLSTVTVDEIEYDLALSSNPSELICEHAPKYFVDQKNPKEYFGAASPKEIFVTRTEINDETRRSEERNLFTYSFLCPEDSDGNKVEWICNADFSAITDENTRLQVRDQFVRAVSIFLDRLGKLNQGVEIAINPDLAPAAEETRGLMEGDLVITLQTDTLMLDPEKVQGLGIGEDLLALYADFWSEICSQDGSEPCLELVDYFAHQGFQGGYLYHRYLGAAERQINSSQYYPYYLTEAGSVFRLKVKNQDMVKKYLELWQRRGLTLPQWAKGKYSKYNRQLWQNCPFVPENGYGEIAVNLNCHWGKQPR